MKLSLACVLLTAATAIANPTPPQRGGRPKKPLEPGWEYSEDTRDHYGARIPIQPVNPQPMIREPSSCIAKCLSSEFRVAGCGHEKDWDCLCRYDGLAPEIQRCVNQNCHSELDLGSIHIQNIICRETVGAYVGTHRPPLPPPSKPNRGN